MYRGLGPPAYTCEERGPPSITGFDVAGWHLGRLFLQLLPLVSNKHLISLLINYRVRRSTSARSSVRPRRLRPLVNCFLDLSSGATSRALAFSLDPRFGKDLSRKTFCFCAEDIQLDPYEGVRLFFPVANIEKKIFFKVNFQYVK